MKKIVCFLGGILLLGTVNESVAQQNTSPCNVPTKEGIKLVEDQKSLAEQQRAALAQITKITRFTADQIGNARKLENAELDLIIRALAQGAALGVDYETLHQEMLAEHKDNQALESHYHFAKLLYQMGRYYWRGDAQELNGLNNYDPNYEKLLPRYQAVFAGLYHRYRTSDPDLLAVPEYAAPCTPLGSNKYKLTINKDTDRKILFNLAQNHNADISHIVFNGANWNAPLPHCLMNFRGLTTLEMVGVTNAQVGQMMDQLMFRNRDSLGTVSISNAQGFSSLPVSTTGYSAIRSLTFDTTGLRDLPVTLTNLPYFRVLTIKKSPATTNNIWKLKCLESLRLDGTEISSVPKDIKDLKALKELTLTNNKKLIGMPEEFTTMASLTRVDLSGSAIQRMPKGTENLLGRKVKIDLSRTKLVLTSHGVGLGQAEIYGALDAVNSQQRAELMMGDIQPYEVDIKEQKRMAEHFANGQNTHKAEVSNSVNASIERLRKQYQTDLGKTDHQTFIQDFLVKLSTFGVEDKVQTNVKALINCALGNPSNSDFAIIGSFAQAYYGYNSAYQLPFLKLFQMVFYAFSDTRKEGNLDGKVLNEKDKQSRIQDFLKLVYQGTIEYGTTGQGYRGSACPGGMTNQLVSALEGIHPAVIIAASPKQLRVMQVNHSIKDALKGLGLKESGYQTLFESISSLMDSNVLKLDQRLLDHIAQQNLQEAKTLMGQYYNVQDLLVAYLSAGDDTTKTFTDISEEISALSPQEADLKEYRVSRQWLFDTMQLCRAEREYRSDKDFDTPLIDEVMPVFDASTGELEKHFRQGAIRVAVREFFKTKISPALRQEIANEKDQKYSDDERAERLQTKIGAFIQTITAQTLKPGQDLVGQLYTAVKTEVEKTFKDDNVQTPLAQLLPQVILEMMKNVAEKSLLRRL